MDVFKLMVLGAALIVLLIFLGGDDEEKWMAKTPRQKWEDRIEKAAQEDPGPLGADPKSGLVPYRSRDNGGSTAGGFFNPGAMPQPRYAPINPQGGNAGKPYKYKSDSDENANYDPDRPEFPQDRPKWVTTPSEGAPAPSQLPGQSSNDPSKFILRSGNQVYFDGAKAQVRDETGKMVPMPDGVYYSQDSSETIYVRGGRRYIK